MIGRADRVGGLTAALAALRSRLFTAADAADRTVEDIMLLPVTKFFPATDVAILWQLGCRAFGESRDQEATAKIAEFARLTGSADARWHMVGQVQRNKAKSIARWADAVHSVSTDRVADALGAAAAEAMADGGRRRPLQVFVQISLDGDTVRGGVDIADPAAVDRICARIADSPALELVGLMAVPPLDADPDAAYAALSKEHRRIQRAHPGATQLSAGMSDDLEAAVRHGSTCVRVGTALMGKRPLTSP